MNKLLKKALFLTLALALILSCTLTFASAAPTTYSQDANSGTRDEVCTTLDGTSAASYYTGQYTYDNLASQSETQLLSSLRTLMTSTHTYRSSYDDCKNYAQYTDCENEDGRVILIYTSYSATMEQWNGWNREHVWPQSLGGDNTSGGGADLHHVRPSDAGVNSSRGNKKYGEVGDGASAKYGSNPAIGYLGGYYNSTYFEPLDNVKGDVARICLYVYTRWGSNWGAESITKVFQSVDVLLEWCALDPVDTWEMGRNEVVYGIQGNRNVFIDYPELAWTLFGEEVPEDMQTPSGKAANGESSGNGGSSSGGTTTCDHSSTTVVGKVSVTCTTDGYSGDVKCTKCNVIVTKGSTIKSNGHSYGDPVVTKPPTATEPGEAQKTCSGCNHKITVVISATGENLTVEIVSNNVYFENNLHLMYALRFPEGYSATVKIYDANGKLLETITQSTSENVNGESLKAYTSKIGVPAQDIDTEFYAVAELYSEDKLISTSDTERYSVLEYLYERLNVSKNVTDAQKTMYKTLLTYSSSADTVINGDSETNIGKYAYVFVENGTLGDNYNTAMLLDGVKLDSVKVNAITPVNDLKWAVVSYDISGAKTIETYTDADLKSFAIKGGMAYILTATNENVGGPTTEKTYSYTFGNKMFSANGTVALGEVNWTLSGDGNYWGYESRGQQLGSKNDPYKSMTLESEEFKNVSKITVNTSGASDINGTVKVYVGDTLVGTITLTTSATDYTFDVSGLTGEVKLEYTQTSSKALYIKSIEVKYAE